MRLARPRFSLRALLAIMTATALTLYFVVRPIYVAVDERKASRQLLNTGATLEHSIYLQRDPEVAAAALLEHSPIPVEEPPYWVAAVAGDSVRLRPDSEVLEAYVHNDFQLAALCDHGHRLRRLEVIDLWSWTISTEAVRRFQISLTKFPHVIDFHFQCPIPEGMLSSLGQARTMFLWGDHRTRLGSNQLEDLAELLNLQLLWIKGYPLDAKEALRLARSTSLRRLYIEASGMDEADFDQLKKAMPSCEIGDKYVPKARQKTPTSPVEWGTFAR